MTRRGRIIRLVALVAMALAALQLAVVALYRAVEQRRGAADRAPAFRGEPLDGRHAAPAVAATRRDGTPVTIAWPAPRARVVHFWGTWCEPCRIELPGLLRFARATPGLEVIAVAVGDDWASIDGFFSGAVPPEVVIAADAADKRYGASTLPDSYLVDRTGKLVERYHGARDWESAAARDRLQPHARGP